MVLVFAVLSYIRRVYWDRLIESTNGTLIEVKVRKKEAQQTSARLADRVEAYLDNIKHLLIKVSTV